MCGGAENGLRCVLKAAACNRLQHGGPGWDPRWEGAAAPRAGSQKTGGRGSAPAARRRVLPPRWPDGRRGLTAAVAAQVEAAEREAMAIERLSAYHKAHPAR